MQVSTLAGSTVGTLDGSALLAQFNSPSGIVSDNGGNVLIIDQVSVLFTFLINRHNNQLSLIIVTHIYISSGEAQVSCRLRRLDWVTRMVTTVAGSIALTHTDGVGLGAAFYSPYGLAQDSSGALYIAEYNGQTIRKIGMVKHMCLVVFNWYGEAQVSCIVCSYLVW